MNGTVRNLYDHLLTIPVIDTHEHLENEWNHPDWNILSDYTRHYFLCDLLSAGMSPEIIDKLALPDFSIREKWAMVEPYWEFSRNTGYGRMLDYSVKTLYGVDELNRETIETAQQGFARLRAKSGYGKYILRDLCGIEFCMNNIWHLNGDVEDGLHHFVTQIDHWVMFHNQELGLEMEQFPTLQAWANHCLETLSDDFQLRGARALKCALAYHRSLSFSDPSIEQAQKGYQLVLSGKAHEDPKAVTLAQDYVMHQILAWADQEQLVLQCHTGYQEGNANTLSNSEPSKLNNLILKYPRVRFDLFHIGYPYSGAFIALGKMFPNVYLNMAWSHILSPVAAKRALEECLLTVPVNKIFAFGGDCLFFDGVIGHLELARQNVAQVLGNYVDEGMLTEKKAKWIARQIFYESPKAFYR